MSPPETSSPTADPAAAALHPSAPFHRALVVANPVAGRGQAAKAARELATGLDRLGVVAEVHLTRGRGDGRSRVRCLEPGTDLVVSVGGDGTLREVFDGLVDPETPVAALPMGTANVLGLDLDLPRDVDSLLEVIRGRRTQRIDVADVNGHLSFLVTGVGFDGHVVRELEARRRGAITRLSYLPAILRALRAYRPPELSVELDGEPLRGTFGLVLISNIVHYGGVMRLRGRAAMDDGRFEVFLFPRATIPALALAGLRGVVASLPAGRSCTMRPASRVRVTSPEPAPYQVDGDFRGTTPVELVVTGRQRLLLVP
jgi:YegS/Rv2252/BmrU family lipid kinase